MPSRRAALLLAPLLASLPVPGAARAGVAHFVDGCIAAVGDFGRLPAILGAAGWREIGPDDGPRGPAVAGAGEGRRLWSRPGPAEAFIGLSGPVPVLDGSLEVCWHVARPGESAAAVLPALRRRYPPRPGTTERGIEFFYGGSERWLATIGGREVIVGVTWPFADRPGEGTAFAFVAKATGGGFGPPRRG